MPTGAGVESRRERQGPGGGVAAPPEHLRQVASNGVAAGDATVISSRNSHGHREACCGLYHRAVELVGKRWTGAILLVLTKGPLRFSEIRQLVPDLSDRLLSERLKELESEGIVGRAVLDESPVRVRYSLTEKGRALEPALNSLKSWAQSWL